MKPIFFIAISLAPPGGSAGTARVVHRETLGYG
jgi:hypothetical protein